MLVLAIMVHMLMCALMGRSPPRTPGLLVVRSPIPGVAQGDRWLSQVPELPLEIHAPLSDPGGVPSARQSVAGTAAFR
jgi:hypothetical protein